MASTTRHPFAANISFQERTLIPGMILSRLCRFRSTTHSTFFISASAGSAIVSHTDPSSSSASPTRLMNRLPSSGVSKWSCRYSLTKLA